MTEPLDTAVAVETPEGILLELRPAGVAVRFYAFLLDWFIRILLLYMAIIPLALFGGLGFASLLILLFALEWLYPALFELTLAGATPGKRAFGLRVVMDNGLPVTPAAALARNLLRVADFLPFGYAVAIVSILVRRDAKRLGDLAAATMVVREPARTAPFHTFETTIEPRPPARPLRPETQAALIALIARAPTLTQERLDELAAIAAPASGDTGRSGPQVTRRVLGVGHWLLGKR